VHGGYPRHRVILSFHGLGVGVCGAAAVQSPVLIFSGAAVQFVSFHPLATLPPPFATQFSTSHRFFFFSTRAFRKDPVGFDSTNIFTLILRCTRFFWPSFFLAYHDPPFGGEGKVRLQRSPRPPVPSSVCFFFLSRSRRQCIFREPLYDRLQSGVNCFLFVFCAAVYIHFPLLRYRDPRWTPWPSCPFKTFWPFLAFGLPFPSRICYFVLLYPGSNPSMALF